MSEFYEEEVLATDPTDQPAGAEDGDANEDATLMQDGTPPQTPPTNSTPSNPPHP